MARFVASVVLAVALAACNNSDGGSGAKDASDYVNEYGGSSSAYSAILASTSCGDLQGQFDIAAANNDAADPGTPAHRQSLGFMTAAQDRMEALGCP